MGLPLIDNLQFLVVLYALCIAFSFWLVWGPGRRLPEDAPMGLVMSLFIPCFAHLYVYKARSLPYVLGLLLLNGVLLLAASYITATVAVTVLSFGIMYWRLVVRREAATSGPPMDHAVTLALDAASLARLEDLCDALEVGREEVLRRALLALPLEDRQGKLL